MSCSVERRFALAHPAVLPKHVADGELNEGPDVADLAVEGDGANGAQHSTLRSWADFRGDQKINLAPDWSADFRPSGANGGLWEPRERIRYQIVEVVPTISPGDRI